MNSKFIKVVTLMLSLSMAGRILAGCGKTAAKDEAAKNSGKVGEIQYPIKTNTNLTYWLSLDPNLVAEGKTTLGETELAKELEKQTGIKVTYNHPSPGQEKEKFNLMVASGDLPDLVEWNWTGYPGGPQKAIKDGVIIKLNDYIDKYAPNFKKYMDEHPEIAKMIKTDDGSYYTIPMIRENSKAEFYGGMLRNDWLKELGMEVPTTVDELETVLKAFKDKKGATAPFEFSPTAATGFLVGAYGITQGYYLENGKVKYGQIESGYKDYLTTLNRWYKEGLLDKNFATVDDKITNSGMLSGKIGGMQGYAGSNMGLFLNTMKEKDPKYDLVAIPYPSLKKGEVSEFGPKTIPAQGYGVSISGKCKDIETAMRFLDYGFSQKGTLLYNFGIENVTYKMENNYPKYTELVTNNPQKKPMTQVMSNYMRSNTVGPFPQKKEYLEQYMLWPQQKNANQVWAATNMTKHYMPNITPTPEESAELAKIQADVDTYVEETTLKFIMGAEPLSNFDKFVAQIKKMNIDRAIQIKQAAVDRFNKR